MFFLSSKYIDELIGEDLTHFDFTSYLMEIDENQIDKGNIEELKKCVEEIKNINKNKNIIILLAGGINEKNIEKYAEISADVLVTSSVYHAKPIDIGNKIHKI